MLVMRCNPTTAWARAGLRTGDQLVAINGIAIQNRTDLQRAYSITGESTIRSLLTYGETASRSASPSRSLAIWRRA